MTFRSKTSGVFVLSCSFQAASWMNVFLKPSQRPPTSEEQETGLVRGSHPHASQPAFGWEEPTCCWGAEMFFFFGCENVRVFVKCRSLKIQTPGRFGFTMFHWKRLTEPMMFNSFLMSLVVCGMLALEQKIQPGAKQPTFGAARPYLERSMLVRCFGGKNVSGNKPWTSFSSNTAVRRLLSISFTHQEFLLHEERLRTFQTFGCFSPESILQLADLGSVFFMMQSLKHNGLQSWFDADSPEVLWSRFGLWAKQMFGSDPQSNIQEADPANSHRKQTTQNDAYEQNLGKGNKKCLINHEKPSQNSDGFPRRWPWNSDVWGSTEAKAFVGCHESPWTSKNMTWFCLRWFFIFTLS